MQQAETAQLRSCPPCDSERPHICPSSSLGGVGYLSGQQSSRTTEHKRHGQRDIAIMCNWFGSGLGHSLTYMIASGRVSARHQPLPRMVGQGQGEPTVDLGPVRRVGSQGTWSRSPSTVTRLVVSLRVVRRLLDGFWMRACAPALLAWVSLIHPVTSTGSAPASSAVWC